MLNTYIIEAKFSLSTQRFTYDAESLDAAMDMFRKDYKDWEILAAWEDVGLPNDRKEYDYDIET